MFWCPHSRNLRFMRHFRWDPAQRLTLHSRVMRPVTLRIFNFEEASGFPVPRREFVEPVLRGWRCEPGRRQAKPGDRHRSASSWRSGRTRWRRAGHGCRSRRTAKPSCSAQCRATPARRNCSSARTAVVEETGETVPAGEHAVHGLDHRGVLRQPGPGRAHPASPLHQGPGTARPGGQDRARGDEALDGVIATDDAAVPMPILDRMRAKYRTCGARSRRKAACLGEQRVACRLAARLLGARLRPRLVPPGGLAALARQAHKMRRKLGPADRH